MRKLCTNNLGKLNVLDCFAGENKIWGNFKTNRYYSIEKELNKGKNIHADNMKILPSLDLSNFNVIDLDSYGIPIEQLNAIFKNPTLQGGTCIIYTCIGNKMSTLNKFFVQYYGLESMYKNAKTLFNNFSYQMFIGYLYDNGIKTVYEYEEPSNNFYKKYGFFNV